MGTLVAPDGYIRGFAKTPGRNAGYRAGRIVRRQCTCHITAGRCAGDRSVIARGYATLYIPQDPAACPPGASQYAELDAVTFGACEWNKVSVHVEVEALNMGVRFSAYAIDRCGLAVAACIEFGIADRRYVAPGRDRFALGTVLLGFVDHQDLQHKACEMHSDGWAGGPAGDQWPAIRAAAAKYLGGVPPVREEIDVWTFVVKDGARRGQKFVVGESGKRRISDNEEDLHTYAGVRQLQLADAQVDMVPDAPAGGPGGGPSLEQIAGIVDAKLAPFRSLLPGT